MSLEYLIPISGLKKSANEEDRIFRDLAEGNIEPTSQNISSARCAMRITTALTLYNAALIVCGTYTLLNVYVNLIT